MRLNHPIFYTLVLFIFVGILSCSKEDDATSPSTVDASTQGTWLIACMDIGGGEYGKFTLAISSTTVTFTQNIYSDAGCTTLKSTYIESNGAVTGATVTVAAGTGSALKVDTTVATITYTAETSAIASSYNSSSECTYTDWVSGTAKDITGKACSTLDSGAAQASAGKIEYDILQIDTSPTPNTLSFGDSSTGAGTSEETRPTNVSTTFLFLKQ